MTRSGYFQAQEMLPPTSQRCGMRIGSTKMAQSFWLKMWPAWITPRDGAETQESAASGTMTKR
jgi:hypothetical protein